MKHLIIPFAFLMGGAAWAADPTTPTLNDPQIATVALTAHSIDVERGKLALARVKTTEVKEFADQMVKDHEAGKAEVLALAKKLNVTPEESAVSRSLKEGAAKTRAELKKLKGAAFEKAYIDAEVAYHQAVIDAINTVLIPQAKNEEVKQALVNTVPTLQGHLYHAKNVQALVEKAKSGM